MLSWSSSNLSLAARASGPSRLGAEALGKFEIHAGMPARKAVELVGRCQPLVRVITDRDEHRETRIVRRREVRPDQALLGER